MSFNPANFAAAESPAATPVHQPAPVVTTPQALREAGARWLKRHDQFADGKADTCFDMADKLEHFGSFISEKQAGYALKLIEWSLPRQYSAQIEATVRPPQVAAILQPAPVAPAPRLVLPKLIDLMQRLAKLRIGDLTISRKNGDSLCWVKLAGTEGVVGKLFNGGTLVLFARCPQPGNLLASLSTIEEDPEAAAARHGRASGRCSVCSRDLTDPESIERGIGPICATKFSF